MTTEPIVVAARVTPPEAELKIEIPADLEYFRGHFAGAPVVPGVVQIKWAIEAARRHLAAGGELAGMEALKFQRVLGPGVVATLTLKWVAAAGKLDFSYTSEGARFSSGRLLFRRRDVKVAIVVPVYNHGEPLRATAARLAEFGLPVLIVDDGSDEATKRAIAEVADRYRYAVVTLARNGGKGHAVMAGLRSAAKQGFTHAVQVDADGQHDLADLPKLLAAAESNPAALICGAAPLRRIGAESPLVRPQAHRVLGRGRDVVPARRPTRCAVIVSIRSRPSSRCSIRRRWGGAWTSTSRSSCASSGATCP